MANYKRTVLITGCSDGGLGAALAIAFHNAGLHVYATARNPSKMKHLVSLGIETLTLDVLSDTSIAACVNKLSSLDILVNNAGAGYTMPISDMSIPEAKKLFDLNVWSYLAVTQAFLPLLLKSKEGGGRGGMIVNHSSVASVATIPFQSAYNASKAAIAMFSDTERLELAPFDITVVDLKSGGVVSNIVENLKDNNDLVLPEYSIYNPARHVVEKAMTGEKIMEVAIKSDVWADAVVGDILKKTPPPVIWRGSQAWIARLGTFLPFGWLDGLAKKFTGMDIAERLLRA